MSRYTRGKEDGKDIPDRGNRRHKDSRYEKACQPSGKGSRVGTQRVRVAALFYLGPYFSNETAKSPEEDMKRKKKKKKKSAEKLLKTQIHITLPLPPFPGFCLTHRPLSHPIHNPDNSVKEKSLSHSNVSSSRISR